MEHYLEVKDLSVTFAMDGKTIRAVDGVSYYIDPGEIVSFVGESGSGKSVTQLAGLQLVATPPGKIEGGQVLLEGQDLLACKQSSPLMREVRGGKIGMVFQEPMTSLNPVKTVGSQLLGPILLHTPLRGDEAKKRAVELLRQVGIPDADKRLEEYPHQFSGGMRQRIMVAMAIAGRPGLIVADEPTTALDVTTQAQILDLLKKSTVDAGAGLLIVTHNLGIVARYAHRIYVMYAGSIVESGRAEDVFAHPSHPYTRGLLKAVPRLDDETGRRLVPIEGTPLGGAGKIEGCPFAPRCPYVGEDCRAGAKPPLAAAKQQMHFAACLRSPAELDAADRESPPAFAFEKASSSAEDVLRVEDLSMTFHIRKGLFQRKVGALRAVDDVSFAVKKGETFGLVGESGCGKTTIAKCVVQLYQQYQGKVDFKGKVLSKLGKEELRRCRRHIQMVFQDPYSSLDPRKPAGELVGEPLLIHKLTKNKSDYSARVDKLFEVVGLDPCLKDRVAHEFSGGQRQRIGIARALASDPALIVCDEPISALDVSIQAQVINLLEDLQAKLGLSYLFIAHDLSVVKHISDHIGVMYLGRMVETASCGELYAKPLHPYTQALLAAVPIPDPVAERQRDNIILPGEVPSLLQRPPGCCFSDRCPKAMEKCRQAPPALRDAGGGHRVACYLYDE